jgi:hypothetical protein
MVYSPSDLGSDSRVVAITEWKLNHKSSQSTRNPTATMMHVADRRRYNRMVLGTSNATATGALNCSHISRTRTINHDFYRSRFSAIGYFKTKNHKRTCR